MGNNQNDFVLDSKGHCFLCLDRISLVKHEQDSGPPTFPKYSVHYLSRYLKMDMRKVFNDMERIPSHLLAKVESSRLKVGLCEDCVQLNEQFSRDYRKLEKAKMELGSSLRRIHAKFLHENECGKKAVFKKLTEVDPHLIVNGRGELEIMGVLREEAFHKSHRKLRADVPRAKLHNLTRRQVRVEKLSFKEIDKKQQNPHVLESNMSGSSKSDLNVGDSKIKLESLDFSSDDDNCPSPFVDINAQNDAMLEDFEDLEQTTEEHTDFMETESSAVAGVSTKLDWKPRTKYKAGKRTWKIIPETERYKCIKCSMEFASKTGTQNHYKSVHLEIRFKCVTCGKTFTHQQNYDRHQTVAHVGVRYSCQVCKKIFHRSDNVRRHQRKTDCGKKLGLKATKSKT